ncbi:VanW family protein [Nocardioides jiangxiensis]|uniref:VanW family protein n=1 Tax=Nocardioides jiangxiensis TaxID=3064524 RepID=A0ABT9B3G2_9ACTN|nr:VanW family protein [Nocardioides sp. WY-20]MDO7868920.1 VanW family protein [Nocardioides sp. WY-20]
MGRRLGGGAVVLSVLLVGLLAGGLYAVAWAFAADRLPRGTTVAGVPLGGLAPAAARDRLEKEFAGHDRVAVTVAGATETFTAAQLGLHFDAAATVEEAGGGRSLDPRRLWDYYAGADEVAPVVEVDESALDQVVDGLEERHGRAPGEGAVRFVGGRAKAVPARVGLGLDRDATRAAIEAAYVAGEGATLPLTDVQPTIGDEEVTAALAEFARPAMSAPVTLVFDTQEVRLRPAQFAPALALVPKDGALVPQVDATRLKAAVDARLGDAGTPVDATVRLVHGVPRVVPGKPGVGYDPKDVTGPFLDVLTKSGAERRLAVQATVAKPQVTTAEARKWGIREKVSTFTTYYPHTDYRNINIPRALSLIDGTVLAPGETFSLNDTVGERTKANGFVEGYVIDGGEITTALGGGVSQVATTTFNAAFFAGLKDVQHKPHSLYFDRYPVGREATVAWPYVDLKFQNDTPYGILIETHVQKSTPSSSGVVTVSMWSTKFWDISATTSGRYNVVEPGSRVSKAPDCEPQEPNTGFDIDVYRHFRRNGEEVRVEKMHTHYDSADKVTCTSP